MAGVGFSVAARLVIVALLCAAAAGCAHNPNQVAVGIGTAAYADKPAPPYAALYLPYAQMASLAYADPQFLTRGATANCPDAALLRSPALASPGHPPADNLRLASWRDELVRRWQCLFGGIGPVDCPRGIQCVEGLQYQVWRRRDCSEAVIAFRGSDGGDAGGW